MGDALSEDKFHQYIERMIDVNLPTLESIYSRGLIACTNTRRWRSHQKPTKTTIIMRRQVYLVHLKVQRKFDNNNTDHKNPKDITKQTNQDTVVHQDPASRLPEEFKKRIRKLAGPDAIVSEEKLLIQKALTGSDTNKHQDRLTIPERSMTEREFLREDEMRLLQQKRVGNKLEYIDVKLIDPSLRDWGLNLKRWEMGKGGRGRGAACRTPSTGGDRRCWIGWVGQVKRGSASLFKSGAFEWMDTSGSLLYKYDQARKRRIRGQRSFNSFIPSYSSLIS